MIESLPPDGVAVINADDPRVSRFGAVHAGRSISFGFSEGADVRAESAEFAADGTRFRALGVDYETSLTGRHAVLNLLAALAVALYLGDLVGLWAKWNIAPAARVTSAVLDVAFVGDLKKKGRFQQDVY